MTGGVVRTLGYSGSAAEGDHDAIERAIQEATSVAETCARALGRELGEIVDIEELPVAAEARARFPLLRITFMLAPSPSNVELHAEGSGDVLQSVPPDFRELYSEFRSRLLSEHTSLRPRPSPINKKGLMRYEGFAIGARNRIYAGFRRRGVKLSFELPKDHDVPSAEYVTRGRRDWRDLLLDRPSQLEGALLLARDAIDGFSREQSPAEGGA